MSKRTVSKRLCDRRRRRREGPRPSAAIWESRTMDTANYRWVMVAAGRPAGLRRDRRDVRASRVPHPDVADDGMVAHRHFERDDDRLSRHGGRQHRLGFAGGSRRSAPGRAYRLAAAGGEHRAGQPGDFAARIPAAVRAAGRHRSIRHFRADDGGRHGLVRNAAQPRGVAGVGGHGNGAADDVAVRRLADLALRLAHGVSRHRCRRRGHHGSACAAGPAPAGAGRSGHAGRASIQCRK